MPTERIRRTFTHTDEQGNIVESREEVIIKREEHEKPTRGSQFKQKALDKTPTKLKNPSNLQVRVRTGAVYITLTVLCIIASDATTAIYLAALSAICAGEFYYMLRSDAKLPNEVLGIVASASFPLAMWLFGINGVVVMVSLFIIVLLVWYVFWLHARIVDVAVSLFGAFYTGLLMSAAMLIRMSVPDYWGEVRQAQDDTAGLAEENLGRLFCRSYFLHGVLVPVPAHSWSRDEHRPVARVRRDLWRARRYRRSGRIAHQAQCGIQGFGHDHAWSWWVARPLRFAISRNARCFDAAHLR